MLPAYRQRAARRSNSFSDRLDDPKTRRKSRRDLAGVQPSPQVASAHIRNNFVKDKGQQSEQATELVVVAHQKDGYRERRREPQGIKKKSLIAELAAAITASDPH